MAETVCLAYHQEFKTPIKIARPFNAYGPYLNLDDGRAIPDFFKNAIEKSKIILHSDGTPSRSFCYVSDSIRGFLKILFYGKPGSIYNVGWAEDGTGKMIDGKAYHPEQWGISRYVEWVSNTIF